MRKVLILLLSTGLIVSAAKIDKKPHWSVCIVGGGQELCTRPLTMDVANAVAYVLSQAPIQGLDLVYVYDTLKPQDKGHNLPEGHPPPDDDSKIKL